MSVFWPIRRAYESLDDDERMKMHVIVADVRDVNERMAIAATRRNVTAAVMFEFCHLFDDSDTKVVMFVEQNAIGIAANKLCIWPLVEDAKEVARGRFKVDRRIVRQKFVCLRNVMDPDFVLPSFTEGQLKALLQFAEGSQTLCRGVENMKRSFAAFRHVISASGNQFAQKAVMLGHIPEGILFQGDLSDGRNWIVAEALVGLAVVNMRMGLDTENHISQFLLYCRLATLIDPKGCMQNIAAIRIQLFVESTWRVMRLFMCHVLLPFLKHQSFSDPRMKTKYDLEVAMWSTAELPPVSSYLSMLCRCNKASQIEFACRLCTRKAISTTTMQQMRQKENSKQNFSDPPKYGYTVFCSQACYDEHIDGHNHFVHKFCATCALPCTEKAFKCSKCVEREHVYFLYYCSKKCFREGYAEHDVELHGDTNSVLQYTAALLQDEQVLP